MGYISENIDWWNEKLTPNQIIWDREYRNSLRWHDVSKMQNITVDYIREFKDELDWTILARNDSISERTLEEFWDRIDWKDILTRREFSEDFLRRHAHVLDWKQISYFQGQLSEEFVEEMKDYIVWDQFNPHESTWEKYSTKFKIRHWNDMKKYYLESSHFWGEEIRMVCDCGEPRIMRVKYSLNIDEPPIKEYL